MDRYISSTDDSNDSPPSAARLFAQILLGRSIPRIKLPEVNTTACRDRTILEWTAGVSTAAAEKLRALQRIEADEREARRRATQFYESCSPGLTEWNESDHPRAPEGTSTGGQWVSKGRGGVGNSSGGRSTSLLDKIIQRNRTATELTGVVTPSMIRSTRIAVELQSAARLPGEVASAFAAGLGTGSKAVANGFATAAKDTVTLGLSPGQLELIGVTKEDRQRGYDTAVAISTASGQVLIAVGTGGAASALSKGGSVVRTAGGALVAFDAAGNAVGVVKGVYDASQNGVTVGNGVQVAAGALGLGANAKTARELRSAATARHLAEVDEFVKKLPRTTTPTRTPADLYEIEQAGPYNYQLSGGGVDFEIDGYRGSTILEAKHVDKPQSSPYVPGSTCPAVVRAKILNETRDRLKKAVAIIGSGSTPFKTVEIVTNTPGSKALFENMLREIGLPGTVRLAP